MFPKTVDHFWAKLEPALQLETHGGYRLVIEIRIGGRGTLVVEVLFDHVVQLVVVASRNTSDDDIRHHVVAHDGIGVVGDVRVVAVAARVVVHGEWNNALVRVAVMIAKNQYGRRGHVPIVVSVTDKVANGGPFVSSTLCHGVDLGRNALFSPELFDAVS